MRLRIRPLAGLGSAAALALALAACGGSSSSSGTATASAQGGSGNAASAVGITPTTVTVGGTFPLTGPAAPGYSEIPPAIEAYFKYVNAQGGIHGRDLKMVAVDDAYNPANTVTQTKKLILQDKVFGLLGALGTPTHSKVIDYVNAEKVPDLFVSSGCLCWNSPQDHPWTFGWQVDYTREGKILGQYIAQHFKGKKIAYFLQNDDFGRDGAKGLDMYIPSSQVVDRETYEPGNTDIGPQMAKIKASGAEVVVDFTVPAYTTLTELAFLKLDYHPQLVVSNVGSDPITLKGLLKAYSKGQAPGTLIDGIITDGYLPPPGTGGSWIDLYKKVLARYAPKLPLDGNVEYGLSMAYTFVKALQAAGQNPTRDSIVKAVETADLMGPGLVPFAYSESDHSGYTGTQIGQIKNGEIVLQGQPMVTDDAGGPITPYTKGHPEAPANGIPPAQ